MNNGINVFLLEYRFDHERMLKPIVEELNKHQNYNVIKINLTRLSSTLQWINSKIKKILSIKEPVDRYTPISSEYKKNVIGEMRANVIGWICAHFFNLLNIIPTIKSKKPDIVVVVNDLTIFGKAAVNAGKILKIPTIHISPGVTGIDQRMPPVSTDYLFVAGEAAKERYVASGTPEEKIFITGNPTYNNLLKRNAPNDRKKICARFNINADKKLVVWTTQPIKEREMLAEAMSNAINDLKSVQFIIKPHPSEFPANLYIKMLKEKVLENAIIAEDVDLYELLNAADCVLTSFSATGLEAMMLDKPVISINLTGEPDRMPYAESGAALGVYHEDELAPAIMNALTDDDVRDKLKMGRESFVERYNYRMDGRAAERVLDLFDEMIIKL